MRFVLFAFLAVALRAEIVDRVAVTVGNSVVTLSEVKIQAKVAAMIEGQAPRLNSQTLRQAAERRIEQVLLRREMVFGGYEPAGPESARMVLDSLKRDRFSSDDVAYRQALEQYEVTEEDLLDQLQWQVTLLRFIEFRFRPGVQVPTEDITAYYEETFLPSWRGPGQPPPQQAMAEQIELILASAQVNNLVDRWLNSTRSQLDIAYREEAFAAGGDSP